MRSKLKGLARLATRSTLMQAAKMAAQEETGLLWEDIAPGLRAYFAERVAHLLREAR